MKKTIFKSSTVIFLIMVFVSSVLMTTAASTGPADFKTIDNFDGYADDAALAAGGYGLYAYGNQEVTIEITSTDAKSGKALKLTNGATSDNPRIDVAKTLIYEDGALGFSFWFNNMSDQDLLVSPLINWVYVTVGGQYFKKTDAAFVEATGGSNAYYQLEVAAGEKVEIAVPFSSYAFAAPLEDAAELAMVMQVYPVDPEFTSLYTVIIDDIKLYGVDDPDPIESEVESEVESTTDESESDSPETSDGARSVILMLTAISGSAVLVARKRKVTAR